MPNRYIQNDITTFGLNKKFFITYILIDKYRSIEDYSWITVGKIFDFYGYKKFRNKPKAFGEIINVLLKMQELQMIQIYTDLHSVDYDTGIEIKINPISFDASTHFTMITSSQIQNISNAPKEINKENILMVFIYICSYIAQKTNKCLNHTSYVCWRSLNTISDDLKISKQATVNCLNYLTSSTDSEKALLAKRELGYVYSEENSLPKKAPNIYTYNKPEYIPELEKAAELLRHISF